MHAVHKPDRGALRALRKRAEGMDPHLLRTQYLDTLRTAFANQPMLPLAPELKARHRHLRVNRRTGLDLGIEIVLAHGDDGALAVGAALVVDRQPPDNNVPGTD